jgi:hypothetical protein
VRLNQKHKYCFVCPADYDASYEHPAVPLPPRRAIGIGVLRRDANDYGDNSLAARQKRSAARKELEKRNLNPEMTAIDDLAVLQTEGEYNMVPDVAHRVEGGVAKLVVGSLKQALDDAGACSERAHDKATTAAVVDDFVRISSGHNTGYHVIPSVKGFSSIQQFTFMMVRSLLFSLLACLCAVPDLFNSGQQTAMISVLTYTILLVRQANAFRWLADTPSIISSIFVELERSWGAAISKYENWRRPKIHLAAHWRQLYLRLGAPAHYSTMYFIEAMQRILKSTWRFTSRRSKDSALQVMRRISVLRWIHNRLLPSLGVAVDPVRAMMADRSTQAYLTGVIKACPGSNALFEQPRNQHETAHNAQFTLALKDLQHPAIPEDHVAHPGRVYPRRAGTFVREGIAAVSVAVSPSACADNGIESRAIFSAYEPAQHGPPGVAAEQQGAPEPQVVESTSDLFLVDYWISYDTTGLTNANPNAQPSVLTQAELNKKADTVIDLAVGHWLTINPNVSTGDANREVARYVLKRVSVGAAARLAILDLGELCQPLWAFPVVGKVADATTFFHTKETKWSAREWLVCNELY